MLIDNVTTKVSDTLSDTIQLNDKLSVLTGLFSIYAFDHLKESLSKVDSARILFSQAKGFDSLGVASPFGSLNGSELENKFRNQLNQKAIAKELDIPVIALSQLNRECEKGNNKRPGCHHLRDSGSLEQDADVVAFLYRDEFYNEDSQHKGITEVIFGKARNFEKGTEYLGSRLDICKFT